jgi:hypothetical protein
VDSAERLERARERAADRLTAIIGGESWATFDHERIALVFSGYDLTGPDIIETASDIADPYSELMVESAVACWKAMQRGDGHEAGMAGVTFGRTAGQTIQGAVMIGLLIGLMAADEKATSETE